MAGRFGGVMSSDEQTDQSVTFTPVSKEWYAIAARLKGKTAKLALAALSLPYVSSERGWIGPLRLFFRIAGQHEGGRSFAAFQELIDAGLVERTENGFKILLRTKGTQLRTLCTQSTTETDATAYAMHATAYERDAVTLKHESDSEKSPTAYERDALLRTKGTQPAYERDAHLNTMNTSDHSSNLTPDILTHDQEKNHDHELNDDRGGRDDLVFPSWEEIEALEQKRLELRRKRGIVDDEGLGSGTASAIPNGRGSH